MISRYLLIILTALLVPNVQAGELPPAFKAHYVVKKGPFELGRSVRELRYAENGELEYLTSSDTSGLVGFLFEEHIQETTRLKQNGARVIPLEYRYRRDGRRDRTITQQFDWQAGHVTSRVNETVFEYPLHEGAIDQSAYQVNLMIDLAKGDREFEYHVASRTEMRTYDVQYLGDERLDTALGELDTVIIQRNAKESTTLWCASALHYLPVKISHKDKNGVFTAYLESVEGLALP
jgi:hypothetical protein